MSRVKKAPENTAVAYLRVSTEEQAESGAGLDAQRAAIEAEALRRGWTIAEWCVDAGASGKSMDGRPELARALEMVRTRQVATLVASKVDRLSRSLIDFAKLMEEAERTRWNLVVLDIGVDMSTPQGEFVATVMAGNARLERRMIGQRTRDALAAKKAAGVRLGRPRSLSDEIIGRIVAEFAAGGSLSGIARGLNADEVPNARGGVKWYPATVRAVLHSQDAVKLAA